MDSYVLFDA
jgi:hypothetical protein